jgi:multiple antibiotic resistance protein
MNDYLSTFIFFFAVIDPIGTIPVFIAVTSGFSEKTKRNIALKATLLSALILSFFVIAGEPILTAISVPLPAFQIAGGIVLFIFALTMIFGDSKPESEVKDLPDGSEVAVFPLAVPSIASPGAMLAAVLMTENAEYTLFQQAQTTLIILFVLLITFLLMLLAGKIHNIIGKNGASVVSRVMGLILASVAASNILEGIKTYFSL